MFLNSWACVWTEKHCEMGLVSLSAVIKRRDGLLWSQIAWLLVKDSIVCSHSSVTGPASFQRAICQLKPSAKYVEQIPFGSWLMCSMVEKWSYSEGWSKRTMNRSPAWKAEKLPPKNIHVGIILHFHSVTPSQFWPCSEEKYENCMNKISGYFPINF